MKTNCGIALKEWAVVNRALGEGAQICVLRKGGIREEDGEFRLKESEFFIFPGWEHQNRDGLQEKYQSWVDDAAPDFEKNGLPIDVYAQVDHVQPLNEIEKLRRLMPFTIWSESFFEKRLAYKPENALHLIVLKCFRRAEPLTLPWGPFYAGCKSWVPLKQELPTDGFQPVLGDSEFNQRKQQILSAV